MYVFNISYHRNATTSFHNYIEKMGYKSMHNVSATLNHVAGVTNNILITEDWLEPMYTADEFVEKYTDSLINFIKNSEFRAFSDNPYPLFYKQLAKEFPDAKFILFRRDSDKWLNSVTTYFGKAWTHFRRILYDSNKDYKYWVKKYEKHNTDVINYFNDAGIPLLIIDIDEEIDISEKINKFLNLPEKYNDYGDKLKFPTLNQIKK